MTPEERWLDAGLPFVESQLPPLGKRPIRVLEIGCGRFGGFVPALRSRGLEAFGVDPEAPAGEFFHQTTFEEYDITRPVDAIVACTSLHHVADLDDVLDRVAAALVPGGVLVVIEWARERFDERTARWCFARLAEPESEEDAGWLHHHRDGWYSSEGSWETYFEAWAAEERLHTGAAILTGLDARFHRAVCEWGPYFFSGLPGITEADEWAAIESGEIRATGLRYSATPR
jgi:SAM-dependent methyltransferase